MTTSPTTRSFDDAWVEGVRAEVEPVLATAEVGFTFNSASLPIRPATELAVLWEAEPAAFARRHPEIVERYGEQWPAPCLDFWVHVDTSTGRTWFAFEGVADPGDLELAGEPAADGRTIAHAFAQVLGLAEPPD